MGFIGKLFIVFVTFAVIGGYWFYSNNLFIGEIKSVGVSVNRTPKLIKVSETKTKSKSGVYLYKYTLPKKYCSSELNLIHNTQEFKNEYTIYFDESLMECDDVFEKLSSVQHILTHVFKVWSPHKLKELQVQGLNLNSQSEISKIKEILSTFSRSTIHVHDRNGMIVFQFKDL